LIHRRGRLLRQNFGELINRDIEPRAATIAGEPALAAVAEDLAQQDRASVELIAYVWQSGLTLSRTSR
jgi:hypothetical protein